MHERFKPDINNMILKLCVTILLFNVYLFAQQTVLFKAPPGNITLPSVIADENSTPKSTGLGIIESKWVPSTQPAAETLLETYSASPESGIRKIINDILVKANISGDNISKLNISFKSSGLEEKGIDKNDAVFNEDFAAKHPGDNLYLVTKLYRTNNAVIEITETGASEFNPEIKNAISEGLRFGNKTETALENRMLVEIQYLVFAFEYIPLTIERVSDKSLVVPMYYTVDIGLNGISTMTVTEYSQNNLHVNIGSASITKPVEFKISNTDPKNAFRVGSREAYSITFIESSGNKVTFSISGFSVSFP